MPEEWNMWAPPLPEEKGPTAFDAGKAVLGWLLRGSLNVGKDALGVVAGVGDIISRPDYAAWNAVNALTEGKGVSGAWDGVKVGINPQSPADKGSSLSLLQKIGEMSKENRAHGALPSPTDWILENPASQKVQAFVIDNALSAASVPGKVLKAATGLSATDWFNKGKAALGRGVKQLNENAYNAVSTRARFVDQDIAVNTPEDQKAAALASSYAKLGGAETNAALARQLGKITGEYVGKSADDVFTVLMKNAKGQANYGKDTWYGIAEDIKKQVHDLAKRKGVDDSVLLQIIEDPNYAPVEVANSTAARLRAANGGGQPLYDSPLVEYIVTDPEVQGLAQLVKELNATRRGAEVAAGVPVRDLNDVLDYMAHITTPEGKAALASINFTPRSFAEFSATHQNVLERQLKGKTINEINDLARQGKLVLGDQVVKLPEGAKLFYDDVATILAVRGFRGEQAMANADFLDKAVLLYGKPPSQAPKGWVEITGILEDNADPATRMIVQDLPEYANLLKGVRFHPEVAKDIVRTLKASDPREIENYSGAFNEVLTNALSLHGINVDANNYLQAWKAGTLALRPSYHAGNIVSNIWQNYLAGVVDPNVYKQASRAVKGSDEVVKVGNKTYTLGQLMSEFEKRGLSGGGLYGRDIQKTLQQAVTGKSIYNQGIDKAFAAQESYENWTRFAHFLDRTVKGDSFDDAAESVRKYLFDYGDLSTADKNLKDFIPFWTFTRKNIPLQFETVFTQPEKVAMLAKAQNVVEGGHETMPYQLRPEYLEGQSGWEYDEGKFVRPGRFIPTLDLSKWASAPAQELAGGLNPVLKTAGEWVFGKTASGYEINPNKQQTIMGVPMSQPVANTIQNMVPGMAAWSEFSRIANKDNNLVAKGAEVLGGKSYQVDEMSQRYWKDRELANEIESVNRSINDPKVPNAVKIMYRRELNDLKEQRAKLWSESMSGYQGY